MAGAKQIQIKDLQNWLDSLRVAEGILRIRLAGKKCDLAVDYWVLHSYAFPSHRDILSAEESVQDRLYQNYLRCSLILNWLTEYWHQPVILLPPHQVELRREMDDRSQEAIAPLVDAKAVEEAMKTLLQEFDETIANQGKRRNWKPSIDDVQNWPDEVSSDFLDYLEKQHRILHLAITLGTRQAAQKLRRLLEAEEKGGKPSRIDLLTDDKDSRCNLVKEYRDEIERTAITRWEPILRERPTRGIKLVGNRLDSIALELVRFLNSKENPDGNAILLISGAESFFGTLEKMPPNETQVTVALPDAPEQPVTFPYVVRPDFFSFCISHAVSDQGQLMPDSETVEKLAKSKMGLEIALKTFSDKNIGKLLDKEGVLEGLDKILEDARTQSVDRKAFSEQKYLITNLMRQSRATFLYSSGIGEQVPRSLQKSAQAAIADLAIAKKAIRERYSAFLASAKNANLAELISEFVRQAQDNYDQVYRYSPLSTFLAVAPQSLNYGFLYRDTSVQEFAETIFMSIRKRRSSPEQMEAKLSEALLKVDEMAQKGDAAAYLLLAHIKTKLDYNLYDEAALEDLDLGLEMLDARKDPGHHFDFVGNIANYHLGNLDQAIKNAVRIAGQMRGQSPRFHLQAGFFYWRRYQLDPEKNRKDLIEAIKFTKDAEELSGDDKGSRALAWANLARAYSEQAILDEARGEDAKGQWDVAIKTLEKSHRLLSKAEWPACVVFATAFIWYEFLRREYAPDRVTASEAEKGLQEIGQKLDKHLFALEENSRWQRSQVRREYTRLIRHIDRLRRALARKKYSSAIKPDHSIQGAKAEQKWQNDGT